MNTMRALPLLYLSGGLLLASCSPDPRATPTTRPASDPGLQVSTALSTFMLSAQLPAAPTPDLLAADALKRAAGYGYPANATKGLKQLGRSVPEQRAAATILNTQARFTVPGKPSPRQRQALQALLKLNAKTDPVITAERLKAEYLLGKTNLNRTSSALVTQVRAGNARAATKLGELSTGATRSNWLRKATDMGDTQGAVQYWLTTPAAPGSAQERQKAKELGAALLQGDAYAAAPLAGSLDRFQTQLKLSVTQGLARGGDYAARAEYGRSLILGSRGVPPQPAAGINEIRISARRGHPLGAVYYADFLARRPELITSTVEANAFARALINIGQRSRTQLAPLLRLPLSATQRREADAMTRDLTQRLKANVTVLQLTSRP